MFVAKFPKCWCGVNASPVIPQLPALTRLSIYHAEIVMVALRLPPTPKSMTWALIQGADTTDDVIARVRAADDHPLRNEPAEVIAAEILSLVEKEKRLSAMNKANAIIEMK